MQSRDEACLNRGEVRPALIFFKAANVGLTITNFNGKLELGKAFATPQVFQQVAKGFE
jgi:hypothetical protein